MKKTGAKCISIHTPFICIHLNEHNNTRGGEVSEASCKRGNRQRVDFCTLVRKQQQLTSGIFGHDKQDNR